MKHRHNPTILKAKCFRANDLKTFRCCKYFSKGKKFNECVHPMFTCTVACSFTNGEMIKKIYKGR